MQRTLTSDQALEVARRLNPRGASRIRFQANGTVVSASTSLDEWRHFDVEVWDCWRTDGLVLTAKVA